MQPRKQKFTESEARDDFNSPGELVEDKVEVKFGDTIEQKFAEQTSLSKPMTRNIFDLIPRPGKDAFRVPAMDEYNVIAAIMRFLYERIFDQDFFSPIDPGGLELQTSINGV
jgi:hypothetical protein